MSGRATNQANKSNKHTMLAQGYIDKGGRRRINIRFNEDTWTQLRTIALKNKISLTETVREMVEWAIEEFYNDVPKE